MHFTFFIFGKKLNSFFEDGNSIGGALEHEVSLDLGRELCCTGISKYEICCLFHRFKNTNSIYHRDHIEDGIYATFLWERCKFMLCS